MWKSQAEIRPSSNTGSRTYLLSLPWEIDAIGGVTRVVVGLYDGIRDDGRLTPRILVASWDHAEPVEQFDEAGRSVVRSRMRSPLARASLLSSLLRYSLALPSELLRLRALVRRYSIEVVNCHYVGSSDFTWIVAKSLGLFRGKVFLSLHGLDIRNLAALRGFRRTLWGWVLRRADAVVACSEGLAAETIAEFPRSIGKVVTIYNGVDLARLPAAHGTPLMQRQVTGPALLNLGTFEHKKGHDVLLHAFRKVLERQPDARLTIMGRSAECTESTLRLVEELDLAQSITIGIDAPHHVALNALKDADIFVLSSRNEAFSIALLEAGALGMPIVATDVCGVAELIQDGTTGLKVPPNDVDALSSGMLQLIENKVMAADCGRRLQELVRAKFSLEENCRNYLLLAGYRPRDQENASPAVNLSTVGGPA